MKRNHLILAAACLSLSSCRNQAGEVANDNSNNASPVVVPEQVKDEERVSEQARYRCENGERIEVDWLSADGHPRLRTRTHPDTIDMKLVGNDYVGESHALNGVETISVISVSWPSGKMKACQKI